MIALSSTSLLQREIIRSNKNQSRKHVLDRQRGGSRTRHLMRRSCCPWSPVPTPALRAQSCSGTTPISYAGGHLCLAALQSGREISLRPQPMFQPVKHRTAGAVQNQNGGRERLTHSQEENGHELQAPVCSGLHGGLIAALDRHGNHGSSATSTRVPLQDEQRTQLARRGARRTRERKGAAKRSTKTEPNQNNSAPNLAQVISMTLASYPKRIMARTQLKLC
jgi:hypothetical protein